MKNKFTHCSMFLVSITSMLCAQTTRIQTPPDAAGNTRCSQVMYEERMNAKDPSYYARMEAMGKLVDAKVQEIENAKKAGLPLPYAQYTIPIVFHNIWHVAAENVPDSRIQHNLDQLNMDFSRTNTDKDNTPASWLSVASDLGIQFCLATKDPSGNPTSGIIHKQTTVADFNVSGDITSSAGGGANPWNTSKYLNVWIGNIGSGLLGYAWGNPGDATCGTALNYCTVGSLADPGPDCPPYSYGRTLCHEIGHNFNLSHIWADDGGACSGSDGVSDTPNQADASYGNLSGVKTDACSPNSPGIMYQNFLDYTDDLVYNLYTAGQKARAQSRVVAAFMTLVNAVPTVCSGATGIVENSPLDNISLFPNPSTGEVSINTAFSGINSMDVKVYNAMGETVLLKSVSIPASKETKIDLGNSPNGIYLFEIKTAEGNMSKKVIINK